MSPEGPRFAPARWAGLHSRSGAGRALRLVRAIRARSAGMLRRNGSLPLTFLNRIASPPPSPTGQTRFEVFVNLSVGRGSGPGALSLPTITRPATTVRPINRPGLDLARPTAQVAQPGIPSPIQRILEKHVRWETAVRYRTADLTTGTPASGPAAVAAVRPAPPHAPELQQPPTRQVARPSAPTATAAETPTRVGAACPGRTAASSQPSAPPLDIYRLTGQVIQAIDRRIIANRERLGRI